MEPTRPAPGTSFLPTLAAALVLGTALLAAAPASASQRVFRAVTEACGVATFEPAGVAPETIETAVLRASGWQRTLPVGFVRAGIRRGLVRARLPRRALRAERAGDRRLCELDGAANRALRWAAEAEKTGLVRGHGRGYWLKRARTWQAKARRLRRELPPRRTRRGKAILIVDVETEEDSPAEAVIAAAGDIAGEGGQQGATSDVLLSLSPTAVLTLGDNAYPDGTRSEFESFYTPSWGRLKNITRPAPGNHEYASGAEGYFDYFGPAAGPRGKGFYSFDLGRWHLIALNSNIARDFPSEQAQWLRADLAASQTRCTLAYWHHPRFSSGNHGNNGSLQTFWDVLDKAGADVVLNGHDHSYERFAPQTAAGVRDSTGVREFVVGTGGKSLRSFPNVQPNSEIRSSESFGVLKLDLHPRSYEWKFVPATGGFTDSGSDACH